MSAFEKKNNSNNPAALQPYDEDTGKYLNDGSDKTEPLSSSSGAKTLNGVKAPKTSVLLDSQLATNDDGFDIDEDSLDKYDISVDEDNLEDFDDGPELQGEKAGIYSAFGSELGLSKDKLNEASDAELEELKNALKSRKDIQNQRIELDKKKVILEKFNEDNALSGIWHYAVAKPSDLIDDSKPFKSTIDKKYQFFKDDKTNPEDSAKKIKQLDELVENSKRYQQQSDELGKQSKDIDGLEQANEAIINKFTDPNSMYSASRKNNAVSVGFKNSKFKTSEQAFEKDAEKQWDTMTIPEQNMLVAYTGSFSSIQEPLYGTHYTGGNTPDEGFKKSVMKMDSALAKCKYDFDCWVQRGTNSLNVNGKDLLDMLQAGGGDKLVGTTFRNKAFMSCGSAKNTGFNDKSIILNIYCPRGTHMHFIKNHSNYENEDETIIARGYEMKIRKVSKHGYRFYVDADIIVGSDDNMLKAHDLEEASKYAE